jgi:enamine deaminase RidA (YjgF/YER057c/UK114 family)
MPVSVLPTPSIPPALGNYSQAVAVTGPGRWVFISGQVGIDSNGLYGETFEDQANLSRLPWLHARMVTSGCC